MCYAGDAVVVSFRYLAVQHRWLVPPPPPPPPPPPQAVAGANSHGSMKQCLCSPTRHPGSFRCRQHHGDYVWGGRVARAGAGGH